MSRGCPDTHTSAWHHGQGPSLTEPKRGRSAQCRWEPGSKATHRSPRNSPAPRSCCAPSPHPSATAPVPRRCPSRVNPGLMLPKMGRAPRGSTAHPALPALTASLPASGRGGSTSLLRRGGGSAPPRPGAPHRPRCLPRAFARLLGITRPPLPESQRLHPQCSCGRTLLLLLSARPGRAPARHPLGSALTRWAARPRPRGRTELGHGAWAHGQSGVRELLALVRPQGCETRRRRERGKKEREEKKENKKGRKGCHFQKDLRTFAGSFSPQTYYCSGPLGQDEINCSVLRRKW